MTSGATGEHHEYEDTSDHTYYCAPPGWRRLLWPGALVLGYDVQERVTDFLMSRDRWIAGLSDRAGAGHSVPVVGGGSRTCARHAAFLQTRLVSRLEREGVREQGVGVRISRADQLNQIVSWN